MENAVVKREREREREGETETETETETEREKLKERGRESKREGDRECEEMRDRETNVAVTSTRTLGKPHFSRGFSVECLYTAEIQIGRAHV